MNDQLKEQYKNIIHEALVCEMRQNVSKNAEVWVKQGFDPYEAHDYEQFRYSPTEARENQRVFTKKGCLLPADDAREIGYHKNFKRMQRHMEITNG